MSQKFNTSDSHKSLSMSQKTNYQKIKTSLKTKLNSVDMYGVSIGLNFDGKVETITTVLGGLVSINYYIALLTV